MLPHLRAVEKGIKAIDHYLNKLSKGQVELDESGRCRIQYQNIGVHINVIPGHDLIIFKTFINLLPDPSTGKVLPLYYHLLDMNDEPETGLAYFSIVAAEELSAENDIISVETKRPITDISFDEFTSCLKTVGDVANHYIDKLEQEFDAPRIP